MTSPILYDIPHRGLRWALGRILHVNGTTDFTKPDSVHNLEGTLQELADLTELHMRHEELYLHGALRERGSPVYLTLEEEHSEHRTKLRGLQRQLRALALGQAPPARSRDFTLALSRFVADDLSHMDHEESNAQTIFEQLFSVEELVALHERVVAAIPAEQCVAFLKVILPGMHHDDRLALLRGPRAGMPPPAFQQLVAGSLGYLAEAEKERLLAWVHAA